MKITVIVPVYNAQAYLDECVDSILSQTYADIELLLIDDGSTDGSPDICDNYAKADPRVRAIHTANGGVSKARNIGLDYAQGEYVVFVDADDTISSALLATGEQVIAQTGAQIVACDFTDSQLDAAPTESADTFAPRSAIEQILYQRGLNCSMCGKLFDKSLFDSGVRFTQSERYEDLDIFYRIYAKATTCIAKIPARLYFYRSNPTSFINNFTPDRLDVLKVTDRIVTFLSDDAELLKAAEDRRFAAYYNMYALCRQNGIADKADQCWSVIRQYRRQELTNPKVRLKNKLGALLSYLGQGAVTAVSRLIYR